jgi:hypothetical protein
MVGGLWALPAVLGMVLGLARWREQRFAYLLLLATTGFIFAVNWDSRYFVTTAAVACVFAGLGGVWVWRRLAGEPLLERLPARPVLLAVLGINLVVQAHEARRMVREFHNPEAPAAIALAPEMRRRLRPGETAMVMTTSTYAWFADRPTVHFVISDRARFDQTLRRLKVRMAVLPTAQLDAFAARFEGGRLPASLVFERVEPSLGVTVFGIGELPGQVAP